MDNYKDLFIDINNFNTENIIYLKPIMFYQVCRNMGVYYKKDDKAKRQKIIIQTPKMIIPFGAKTFDNDGKKSYQISLSFTSLTNLYNEDEIKKFYQFIQKIDRINEETVMEYRKKWGLPKKISYRKTLQRFSKDYPHHMNLNLPHDEKHGFLFNVYDENAKKSNIDILDKKSIVSVVMELTDLRFTDKYFRSNWTIMQIRKFKPYSPIQDFFMSGCFICDQDDPEDKVYAQLIERYQKTLKTPINIAAQIATATAPITHGPPMLPPSMLPPPMLPPPMISSTLPSRKDTNNESRQSSVIMFQPPSLEELLNAKGSLKKTNPVIKENMKNSAPISSPQLSQLPPLPPPLPVIKKPKTKKQKKC